MATTPFETVILKMRDLGFFKFFFPFLLTSAIFYGLLRKSQLFGDPDKNIAVNAIIAMVASFFVWAMPVILGVDIETQLARFFAQGVGVTLAVMVALMIAGMFFPPDLAKSLSEKIKAPAFWGGVIVAGILIMVIVFVSSGLYKVLFPQGLGINWSNDIFITLGVIILLIVTLVVIVKVGK